jgi:hypothetical protein
MAPESNGQACQGGEPPYQGSLKLRQEKNMFGPFFYGLTHLVGKWEATNYDLSLNFATSAAKRRLKQLTAISNTYLHIL